MPDTPAAAIYWKSQSMFLSDAQSQSSVEGITLNSIVVAPLGGCLCDTSDRDRSISSRIIVLLIASSPAAIIGGVIAVIVSAVQRCAVRFAAHIGKEILERSPAITISDATAAVIFVRTMLGVSASLFHVVPGAIGRSAVVPMNELSHVRSIA